MAKKFTTSVILLLAALAIAPNAGAQVTVVQTCEYVAHITVSSGSCTFASPIGANHFILTWGVYGTGFGTPSPASSNSLTYNCPGASTSNTAIGDVSTGRESFCYAYTGATTGTESTSYTSQSFGDYLYFVSIEYAIAGGVFDASSITPQNGTAASASESVTSTKLVGALFGVFAWAGKAVNPTLTMSGFTIDFNNNTAIAQGFFGCCATSAMGVIIGHKNFTGTGAQIASAQSGVTAAQNWITAAFDFGVTLQTRNHAYVF